MHPIRTLEDLIHAARNSLSTISSYSQYLLGQRSAGGAGTEELQIIYAEAERAAGLLGSVPLGLARSLIQGASDPGLSLGVPGEAAQLGTMEHGKGQR